MRPLPDADIFSRRDAKALGWTDSALTRAVRAGRVHRVRHGLLTASTAISHRQRAEAAVLACGGSVMSHCSVLIAVGLPVVGAVPAAPELTVQPRRIGRVAGAHLHRATLWPCDVVVVDGCPRTTVARTVIDVARSRSTATAVAAIDAALHAQLATRAQLEDVLVRCWNWPGIRRAQRAVSLADGRAESPLESVSRLVIGWLHLPAPDLQAIILDERGYPVGRLDFYWDEYGAGGEADGRSKYDDRGVLIAEKDRQERVEDLGVELTRWGWVHATRRPHELRTKISRAFERGVSLDRSRLRRTWSVQRTPRERFE